MMRRLAAAVLLLALATAVSAQTAPLIAAHRGGAALWPENSLAAVRGALALGVDALEFDVHLTADGEPVVIHDPTLERTTTLRGLVRETTREALRAARLRDAGGAVTGELVPTLAEVLDVAAAAPRVEVLPEIKTDHQRQPYPGIEERVIERLGARGLLARATVQSFDAGTLKRVRALEPSLRTMFLVSQRRLTATGVTAEDSVRWAKAVGATDLGIDHRVADASVIAAARAAGLRLSVWTVNAETDLVRMRDLGPDVVMTDRPDLARRLFGRP
jgi:glycerophosphoryl diester phosphodiesterase